MKWYLVLLVLLILALAACSPQEVTLSLLGASMSGLGTLAADSDDTASSVMVDYNGPDWAQLTLTNARTGEPFTLADFAGKTVFVEPMATWCTNCLMQQRGVREVIPQLNSDEYLFLSISVEPNITNADLAGYADRNEFNWIFALITPEMLQALTSQFGRAVVNPPATPHFTISPAGAVSDLHTGGQVSAEGLIAELTTVHAGG